MLDITIILATTGLLLIAIDIIIIGTFTIFLTAVGAGLLMTASASWVGLISPYSPLAVAVTGTISSFFVLAVTWRPLKKLQNNASPHLAYTPNDIVGAKFILNEDYTPGHKQKARFSGVDWYIQSKEHIASGAEVLIKECHVGRLVVEPISVDSDVKTPAQA